MKRILFSVLVLFAFACEDQDYSSVPEVNVYSVFYLDDPEFFDFDLGTSIALDREDGGYAGLILYRVSQDIIYAYDRCCPIHVNSTDDRDEAEQLEVNGAYAICPSDSAYFILSDHDLPIELGNSSDPSFLRTYRTSKSGNTLIVRN